MTLRAAGILFRTPDGRALFLKRGPAGDHAGEWCLPGGKIEAGESAEEAAMREAIEEVGSLPAGDRVLLCRNITEIAVPPTTMTETGGGAVALPSPPPVDAVDFSTFLQDVPSAFDVVPDDEHVGFAWAPLSSPPEPAHPGLSIAIERLGADELAVARMMAAGRLTSPQRYKNLMLWAMRITGTGVAVRRAVKDEKTGKVIRGEEFPWRDPALYMTEDFLARCNGLAVIWRHPDASILDSKEYVERVVGSIFLPYLRPEIGEVWGIAKVYDEAANAELVAGTEDGKTWSTSPAVVLSDPNNPSYKLVTEDGQVLLIEGKPSLLDHLAICERGVWDKGGEPAGIINHELETEKELIMADEEKKVDASEENKSDATLDKVLSRLDACMSRMDSIEDLVKDKKADADKEKADAAEAERVAADKKADEEKKADADKDKDDVKDDAARADAAAARADAASARTETAELRKVIDAISARVPVERTDSDLTVLTAAQVRADSVYRAFGKAAPRFLNGEDVVAYRRRLAREFQEHSPTWKPVDLGILADSVLSVAEEGIYADAMAAAMNPKSVDGGGLRMVSGQTSSGHREVKFYGNPASWMNRFAGSKRYATRINPNARSQEMN